MMSTISIEQTALTAFSIFVTIVLAILGWGIRAALIRFSHLDTKVDRTFSEITQLLSAFRLEIKEYLKDCVRHETCKAYRDTFDKELRDIKAHLKFGRRYGDSMLTSMVKHFNENMMDSHPCENCDEKSECPTNLVDRAESLQTQSCEDDEPANNQPSREQ